MLCAGLLRLFEDCSENLSHERTRKKDLPESWNFTNFLFISINLLLYITITFCSSAPILYCNASRIFASMPDFLSGTVTMIAITVPPQVLIKTLRLCCPLQIMQPGKKAVRRWFPSRILLRNMPTEASFHTDTKVRQAKRRTYFPGRRAAIRVQEGYGSRLR